MAKQVIRNKIKEVYNINDEKPIFTLLVDGNSLLKQSLVNETRGGNGKDYGPIFQFYYTLGQVLTKYDFQFCYLFWDAEQSGQLRYNIYPEYKANRDKNFDPTQLSEYDKAMRDYCKKVIAYSKAKRAQKELVRDETEDERFERCKLIIKQIAEELFLRSYEAPKYVEGDDLIAYYIQHKKSTEKIVILTRDRDLTQLIADDVSVYLADLKKFIHPRNHIQEIGYTHENVLLKKILCGDTSDNIKGVKGLGEKTLFDMFPNMKTEALTLEEIMTQTQLMVEERLKSKKKPLVVMENILKGVTSGVQGDKLYEINEKIINLKKPLLTDEAIEDMESMIHAPMDPEGRDIKNLYLLIQEHQMINLYNEAKFGATFSPFYRIIENEKQFFKKTNKKT